MTYETQAVATRTEVEWGVRSPEGWVLTKPEHAARRRQEQDPEFWTLVHRRVTTTDWTEVTDAPRDEPAAERTDTLAEMQQREAECVSLTARNTLAALDTLLSAYRKTVKRHVTDPRELEHQDEMLTAAEDYLTAARAQYAVDQEARVGGHQIACDTPGCLAFGPTADTAEQAATAAVGQGWSVQEAGWYVNGVAHCPAHVTTGD